MQSNNEKSEMTKAGFWVRLAAFALDNIIAAAGLLIVRLFLSGMMNGLEGTLLGGNLIFQYTLKDIILYIGYTLYFVLFTYNTGTTIGKRAMNLQVIHRDDSRKLSLLNVIYRETIGRFLCKMTLGIGYLIIGFSSDKMGLHDMLCDTQVIYAKKVKVYEKTYCVPAQAKTPCTEYDQMENTFDVSNKSGELNEKKPRTIVLGGYHLTDEAKIDIVDEVHNSNNHFE